ncbi:GNAT family N-acetyltransferase [Chlamydiota bacterium]
MVKIKKFKKNNQEAAYRFIHDILLHEVKVETTLHKMDDLKDISSTYNGKKDIFNLAFQDKKIIGTVAIKQEDENTALLRRFFVDRLYRSKGIGTKLLKKAIAFAYKKGYKKIVFHATSLQLPTISLCEKSGFMRKEVIDIDVSQLYRYEKLLRGTKKEILSFITHR